MSEEAEVDTRELQETIDELHEERRERRQEQLQSAWTRYIAVATAVLAVFAAIAALQSGSQINEATMDQLKASDTWNQYQASRLKDHLYTLQAQMLLDRGAAAAPHAAGRDGGQRGSHKTGDWVRLPSQARLRQYIRQAENERAKETDLALEARKLERESALKTEVHHQFARAVALIQVAISLAAVAALTRMKSVWWLSLLLGAIGLAFFGAGWWMMTHGA